MADFPHATNSPAGPGLLCRRLGAWIVFAIFLSGVVFRIAEYAADRSLWLDEAALASDILHQPLADLAAGRLHDSQVAPPGFALAVRLVTAIGGDSEPMLRLVSFVAGLATLTIITLLAWHRLNPVGAAATVALTAWSWPLIYYTNECKQYSTDALWAVSLFALAGKILGQSLTTRRAIAVGLAGCAALVFSQPALFGLAALGLSGITSAAKSKQRGEMVRWAVLGAVWLMLFALQMALSFNSTLGNKVLFTYHQNTFLTLWPLEDARQGLHDVLLGDWVSATAGTWQIWLGLLALGLWAGRQKHRQETVFIMLTLSGVAAASLLHVYPLAVRLVLFLFPLLFWLVGQGAAESAGWARGRAAWFVVPLLIWAAWPMGRDGVAVVRRPVAPEHLRPVAATLA